MSSSLSISSFLSFSDKSSDGISSLITGFFSAITSIFFFSST